MKKIVLTLLSIVNLSFYLMAQGPQALYPGAVPNYIDGPNEQNVAVTNGISRIAKVTIPTYQFYSAGPGANKPCVIVCPGGGYGILASSHEGSDIAKKFNEKGIHALVLFYRLPDAKRQIDKRIAPLQDAQQAIRVTRQHAAEWGIDPKKIGIMGFSAGGHLAASVATHFNKDYTGMNDGANLRPDFQILLYPVISFRSFGHQGSAKNLIGPEMTAEDLHLFSNEEQVTSQTPPAFLVHAADDKAVPVKNSLLYVEKLSDLNISSDLHVYAKGGHGFGLNNKTTSDDWFESLVKWFKTQSLL